MKPSHTPILKMRMRRRMPERRAPKKRKGCLKMVQLKSASKKGKSAVSIPPKLNIDTKPQKKITNSSSLRVRR